MSNNNYWLDLAAIDCTSEPIVEATQYPRERLWVILGDGSVVEVDTMQIIRGEGAEAALRLGGTIV